MGDQQNYATECCSHWGHQPALAPGLLCGQASCTPGTGMQPLLDNAQHLHIHTAAS